MIDLVNSEAYSQATSQWLDTYMTISQPFKHVIETTMAQVLTGLNMPTLTEVTSLAARMTNIEMRLDDQDAKLGDIKGAIQAISGTNHAVPKAPKVKGSLETIVIISEYGFEGSDSHWTDATIIETIHLPKTQARNDYPSIQVTLTPAQLEGYLFLAELGDIGGDPLARSVLSST